MQRRVPVVVLSLLLLATVVTGALLFARTPRVTLSEEPDAADAVTLYQGGLAFVELQRSFTTRGGDVLLELPVPATTVLDSLEVTGEHVTVKEVRSSLAAAPLVGPGDRVTVHVGDNKYTGTVLSADGGDLVLDTATGTTIVDAGRADAIEVTGRKITPTDVGSAEVLVLVDAPAGEHAVQVSYLAQGPGWTPSYRFETTDRSFTFHATLTGLHDWSNVSLDLVAGQPSVVYRAPLPPSLRGSPVASAEDAGSGADVSFGPSAPLGDLHRYHLERKINLTRGQSLRLAVLDGAVEIVRHRYDAAASVGWGSASGQGQDVTVLERYELRNTLTEPLPAGIVRLYEDGTWFGEDMLAATPVGDRVNVTASTAQEIKARVVLERLTSSASADTYVYALTVRNLRAAGTTPVDVHASLAYPTYSTNLLGTQPPATRVTGGQATWDDTLPAGAAKTYRLTYEQLVRR